MFLSRLNPVSVFHNNKNNNKNKNIVVSIPPKSGLSFSRYWVTGDGYYTVILMFLSRLNPVSVFHL